MDAIVCMGAYPLSLTLAWGIPIVASEVGRDARARARPCAISLLSHFLLCAAEQARRYFKTSWKAGTTWRTRILGRSQLPLNDQDSQRV